MQEIILRCLDVMDHWETWGQVWVVILLPFLFLFFLLMLTRSICHYVIVLFRGWPPAPQIALSMKEPEDEETD